MLAHFTPNNEIHTWFIPGSYQDDNNAKSEIHFAVEGLKIVNNEDIEKVENIWSIKVLLPKCLKTL